MHLYFHTRSTRLLCRLLLGVMLSAAVVSAASAGQSEGAVLEEQSEFHSIVLDSGGTLRTFQSGNSRVFITTSGGQIRQGPVRIWAPRMVVWFDRQASSATGAAHVTVYAEGSGMPGKKPGTPLRLVEGDRTRELGGLLLNLRSRVGFARRAEVREDPEASSMSFFRRASSHKSDSDTEFARSSIPPGPTAGPSPGVPVSLKSNAQYRFQEGENRQAMVFLGDVRVDYKQIRVRSDSAVVWSNQATGEFEVYARGDVRVSMKGRGAMAGEQGLQFTEMFKQMNADELYINPGSARGLAANPELRLERETPTGIDTYVIDGKQIYMLNSRTLLTQEGSLSTCSFAEPHWKLWADRYRITQGADNIFLTMWDAGVGIQGANTPSLPFLATNLAGEPLFRLNVGSRDRYGTYLRTTWSLGSLGFTAPWLEKWMLDLDYYGDRGPAVGTRLQYNTSELLGRDHTGRLKSYYVKDTANQDTTGRPVTTENRGQVWLQHRSHWTQNWRTDLEYHWLSDRGFRNEFFEDEFETSKRPESFVTTRYLEDNTWAGLTFQPRVNDFLTQVEEMPSAEINWLGVPASGFVYDGGIEAGRYDLEPADRVRRPDPPDLTRLHTQHKLSYPFSLGFLRFDPYLQGLATYAGKGARQGGAFTDSQTRAGGAGGLYSSTTLARPYPAKSELFDVTRLRHVIIPYTSAQTLSVSGDTSSDFIQMDQIDTLDDTDRLSAGFRQNLQTKRGEPGSWKMVELLTLDTELVTQSSDSTDPGKERDFVEMDMTARPTSYLDIHSRDNVLALNEGDPDIYNIGIGADLTPTTRVSVDYDMIEDVTSTLSTRLYYRLSDRWMLYLDQKYDLDSRGQGESEELESAIHVARKLHCWMLDLGLEIDEVDNETEIIFGLSPVGWGEGLMQEMDIDQDYYER